MPTVVRLDLCLLAVVCGKWSAANVPVLRHGSRAHLRTLVRTTRSPDPRDQLRRGGGWGALVSVYVLSDFCRRRQIGDFGVTPEGGLLLGHSSWSVSTPWPRCMWRLRCGPRTRGTVGAMAAARTCRACAEQSCRSCARSPSPRRLAVVGQVPRSSERGNGRRGRRDRIAACTRGTHGGSGGRSSA